MTQGILECSEAEALDVMAHRLSKAKRVDISVASERLRVDTSVVSERLQFTRQDEEQLYNTSRRSNMAWMKCFSDSMDRSYGDH